MNQSMSVMPLRDLYPRMIIQTSEHFRSGPSFFSLQDFNLKHMYIVNINI